MKSSSHWYIFGLGKTGRSLVSYCQSRQIPFWIWDDNPKSFESFSNELIKDPGLVDWKMVERIVLSPGIPHDGSSAHPALIEAKKHKIPITVDVEVFLETLQDRSDVHVIGITGTNGKSTTTSLISHLLNHFGKKARVGGNIGIPVLDLPKEEGEIYYILELSSYQLTLLETPIFECAVLLNIAPDHLAYHGTMKAYESAKSHLFELLDSTREGRGMIIIDDEITRSLYKKNPTLLPISTASDEGAIYLQDNQLIDTIHSEKILIPFLKNLQGSHNAQNVAAAYGVVRQVLGKNFQAHVFLEGLETFRSLPHRQEIIDAPGSVVFVNDSKATNMDAAEKSLKVFNNIHWILGGLAKDGETPKSLASLFPRVRHTYLIGSSMDFFAAELEGLLSYTKSHTMLQALKAAYAEACPGDVILLAPACASFDQFKNFEERGNLFKQEVLSLTRGTHV